MYRIFVKHCLFNNPCQSDLLINLATSDAHAAVIETKFLQREAGDTLQQLLNALYTIWTKCVVAEV